MALSFLQLSRFAEAVVSEVEIKMNITKRLRV